MKKTIMILALCTVAAGMCGAQGTADRQIRVAYGYIAGKVLPSTNIYGNDYVEYYSGSLLSVDADLVDFGNNITGGFYLGTGPASYEEILPEGNMVTDYHAVPAVRLGIGVHWHLLDAIDSRADRWDISINGSLGSYWSMHMPPQTEYSASVAVAFYPFRHWGLFVESGWGKFHFSKINDSRLGEGNCVFKAGVSYRF